MSTRISSSVLVNPMGGGAGDFVYHKLALPAADFSLQDLVHYIEANDTSWRIAPQTVAAVPAVPAVFTHSQLNSGIRTGYNFLNPSNRDPIPTIDTTGYIFFNTTRNRFRKLDAGAFRAFQGTDTDALATNTVVSGRTFAGSFQNQQAALNAGANAADQWFYHISLNQLHYWDDVDNTFRQVGGVGALNFPNYFGSNFIWLQSVNSPSDLDDYFDNNNGNTARSYYWYNTVTSTFNVSTWLAPNFWEDVTIDWILDDPNAIFLGINGLEGTDEIDLPAEVETYLDTEDNYESPKTYIFHNNANATPIDGTVARFTNSQSSSYQGVHSADTRPDATTLSVHDWVYDTTGGQLAFVVFDAIASPPANKWIFAGDNTELDSFFPSVGYSWAGRNTDGPYENDHTLTEAELLQGIADGIYDYDVSSPVVYFDTTHNQLRYITSYSDPNYGRIHEVDSFTPTVPEVPSYEMPIWEEVLEGGDFDYHRLALPDADFSIQDKVHFRASDDTAWKILSQTVAAVPAVPPSLTHAILSSIRTGYAYQPPSGRDIATTPSSVAIVYYNAMTNRFRKLDAGGVIPIDRAVNHTIASGTVINGRTFYGVHAGAVSALGAGWQAGNINRWFYNTNTSTLVRGGSGGSENIQASEYATYFGANFRWLGLNQGLEGSEGVVNQATVEAYFADNPPDTSLEYYYYNSNGTFYRVEYQSANNWEDVDIDWVLDSDSALFLGENGVEGTDNLDLPADVRAYLDMAGNYDATDTYVFYNQTNATPTTGGSAAFTSSQASGYQGSGPSASRPTADSLDVHDWWYNTSTDQLQYVATSGGSNIWLIATSNVLLDIFFPSVGYSWAGRDGSGPYNNTYEATPTELLRAIADGELSYDSTSPLVFYDTANNRLAYITSYNAPVYGQVDTVTAFTATVPEVPSFERAVWDEVLESGGGAVAQTEAEIRTLLSFTVAEQQETIVGPPTLAAGIITFTHEDGGTTQLTLPSSADGVVNDLDFDDSSRILTLTRSGTLTPITVDLSSLVDEFEDEQAIEYVGPGDLSGVNSLTASIDGVTAYGDGMGVAFVAESSNSGAMTLRVNSLPFRSIRDINGNILTQNAIAIGKLVIAFYQASSQTWRSNIYVRQDISGKANSSLNNLDTDLTVNEQAAIQQKLNVPNTQFAGPSNAGLMPSNLYNKLAGIETGATADQTAAEIRVLFGFTIAEQQETIVGAPTLSGNVLTFTHEDGGTTQLTLPTQAGTTDGVVTGVAFNETTRVLTLTRSGGLDPLTEDLSALQDERVGEQIHFISDPALIAGTNSVTLTIPGVQTYEDGLEVAFIAENANTGAVAIGVNTLSTTVARRNDDTAFTGGEITVGKLVIAFYDDTVDRWRTNVRPPFEIPDGSITRAKVANSAINGDKIDAGVIIPAHLAPDAVTPSKIETNAIENRHYSDGSITQEKFASSVNLGGTTLTTGAAFPASPSLGDIHIFDAAATGLTNTVNNTASQFVTSANIGDVFKFTTVGSNDRWVLEVIGGVPDDSLTTAKYRDGSVTEDKLAFGIGTDLQVLPRARSESITLQSSGAISSTVNDAELFSAATSPIAVEFGEGVANILSVTGGQSVINVLRADVYDIDWIGTMDVSVARAIPRLAVYRSGDTIGTDEPIVRIDATYFRATGTGEHFTASGHLIIPEDNTTIKLAVERIPSLTGSSTPIFTIVAGSKLFFSRGAAGGMTEEQVLDFVTERIRHTIRRRNILGAGNLQVGDVRFDATTITLNVHTDLDDGWLGDLPVGAEINMHGLTSGARSRYTLDSVTESGDDATLTVTRDTHSGIFTNNETVVITFDQEHDPQSSWTETDPNRPAFIKGKPDIPDTGRTFYWMNGQTERIGTIVTASRLGMGNRRARFDSTQREESNGGIGTGLISFVASGDVDANADIVFTGETFEDNQFFTVNGTIDLLYQAHTRADDDDTFVARLVKVRAGDDDILLQESASSAKATQVDSTPDDAAVFPQSSIGNTVDLEYKSLTSDGTEQFSIQLLGFFNDTQSGIQGHMMTEKV